ncbi:hypothetical protein [Microbacterium sp. 10M-3C3]|jgi:hypothetical protein|uniref:hypothetical protein n=1 Tax=Microbacterium sp. 10M-3C3 TaxID=2483401 RepID=UPI000F6381FD|nr:hypothetical protein [Microbacterium sp. 10M-3C3]
MGERKDRSKGVRVPRHGYAFVTVTARDANGFVHHFDEIEAPVGSLHEAIAVLQVNSTATQASHREAREA